MKKTLVVLAVLTLAMPMALLAGPDDPIPQQAGGTQQPCPMMGAGMQKGCGQGMGQGMGMFGQGRRGHGDRGPECILGMVKELELTDQQVAQIKKLRSDFELQQVDRHAEMQKAQIRLRELKNEPKSAESDVLAQIEKVGQLRIQNQKAMYSHHRAMQNVLTEEQRTKLKELRADAFDDDDDMPGGCMGGRGQGQGQGGHRGR
jgi:Spy/CpxP family protein refolding chaperone